MGPLWGIDLGGTKIEGVILENSDKLNVIRRTRIPTEAHKGYPHILKQIHRLTEVLSSEVGMLPEKIGIGTPGALDPITNTLKNANTTCLNGQPFKQDLEDILGIPISIANDANCFAMAEAKFGAAKEALPDANVVFGVIMGTGVGGGVVVNGKVINGRQGIAGEWGHNFLDDSGGDCYCGKVGCVERIISGPSLERFHRSLSGNDLKLKEIVARYHDKSDAHAIATMERLIHFFGKGLASVINMLDPDVIVLGGGVSNIDLLYDEGIESIKNFVFNPRLDTIILKPKLGDSAGVFGAALL